MPKNNAIRKAQQKAGSSRNKRSIVFYPGKRSFPTKFSFFSKSQLTTTMISTEQTNEKAEEFLENYENIRVIYKEELKEVASAKSNIRKSLKQNSSSTIDNHVKRVLAEYCQYSKSILILRDIKMYSKRLEEWLTIDLDLKKQLFNLSKIKAKYGENYSKELQVIQKHIYDEEQFSFLSLVSDLKNHLKSELMQESQTEEQKELIQKIQTDLQKMQKSKDEISKSRKISRYSFNYSGQFSASQQDFKENTCRYSDFSAQMPSSTSSHLSTTSLPSSSRTVGQIIGYSAIVPTLLPILINTTESLIKHLSSATNITEVLAGSEFNATQSNVTDLIPPIRPSSTKNFIFLGIIAAGAIGWIGATLFYKYRSKTPSPNHENIELKRYKWRSSKSSRSLEFHSKP